MSAPARSGRSARTPRYELVTIMVCIVVVPITIGVPAVAVFVPPAMAFVPAAFPRLVQIVARAVRLPAVPAVMLHGFVQSVIGFGDAALATIVTLGRGPGCTRECQHPKQCGRGQHHSGEKLLPSRLYGHVSPSSIFRPCWMGDWAPTYKTLYRRECSNSRITPIKS